MYPEVLQRYSETVPAAVRATLATALALIQRAPNAALSVKWFKVYWTSCVVRDGYVTFRLSQSPRSRVSGMLCVRAVSDPDRFGAPAPVRRATFDAAAVWHQYLRRVSAKAVCPPQDWLNTLGSFVATGKCTVPPGTAELLLNECRRAPAVDSVSDCWGVACLVNT